MGAHLPVGGNEPLHKIFGRGNAAAVGQRVQAGLL